MRLARIDHSLFSALGVVTSGLLSGDLRGPQPEYLVAFSTVLLSAAGSFAFNDYFDLRVDTLNGRIERPLVAGALPRSAALLMAGGCLVAALLLSLLLGPPARGLVLLSLPLFYLYSAGLKRLPIVKNLVVAFAFAVTILFGAVVSDDLVEPLAAYFALMGFVVGLAFDVMLDLIDLEGDRAAGISTLPAVLGPGGAALFSTLLYALIMVLDPLPFFLMIDSRLHGDYVFLAAITVPVLSYLSVSRALLRDQAPGGVLGLRGRVVSTMQAGCVAYLLGVLL